MKKYKILQIKNDPQVAHGIKFSGLDELEKFGLRDKLTLDIYKEVYSGEIENGEISQLLERIYSMFQGVKPVNYNGHSISVSDVVCMDDKYYFCDRYEWKEITFPTKKNKKDLYTELADILTEAEIFGEINTYDNRVEIHIEWGDWKHDHAYLRFLMEQKGFVQTDENVTEEDGSDCYSAIHVFKKAA